MIVVDTGPLYAAADIDDARHAACVAVFQGATEQLVVPVSVVIESSFLIERHLGPARLSNPAVDFVQACDQGRRGRECREDIDAGAGRRIGPGNRQVQRRLGRADVERLLAAYKGTPWPSSSPVSTSTAPRCSHISIATASLGGRRVPSSALRMSHGPQVSIATGSHSLAIGQRFRVNASTVGKALRRAEVQLRPRRGWASGK